MDIDLDTFLVALYTLVDDAYKQVAAPHKPRRPGHPPELADSEVLTLMILTQWLGGQERAMLRYAAQHWRAYFPRLLDQSAFNRRTRDLGGVAVTVALAVAQMLGAALAPYQALDCVPVPLARRCRGDRHRQFGLEAQVGKGGSDKDWYYGGQLLAVVTPSGVITGFLLGPATTANRWLGEALFCWRHDPHAAPWGPDRFPPTHQRGGKRRGPTGPLFPSTAVGAPSGVPYLADDGFSGPVWTTHWLREYGAVVLTRRAMGGPEVALAQQQHSSWRQIIETVNAALIGVFALSFPGAHTTWGLVTRIAAKVLAFNLGIAINRRFGRPDLALATLFSC